MNSKLRILVFTLVILCVVNVSWRLWTARGLITINADSRPVAEVIHQFEKQGHIPLRSNLAADATVTMHVRKVPLFHAMS